MSALSFAKVNNLGIRSYRGVNRALMKTGKLLGKASDRVNSAILGIAFLPHPIVKITDEYRTSTYRLMGFASTAVSAATMWIAAKREGISQNDSVKAYLWGVLGGVLGALGLYQLETLGVEKQSFIDAISGVALEKGQDPFFGFSWFGGLGISIPTMLFYARIKKIPIRKFLDALAPAGLVFHALARVGCLLHGCCYGTPTDLPWGVEIGSVVRHPTPFYHTLSDLIFAGIVWKLFKHKKFDGQLFLTGLSLHTLSRFLIEFLRVHQDLPGVPLTVYQLYSLGIFTISTLLLGLGLRRQK